MDLFEMGREQDNIQDQIEDITDKLAAEKQAKGHSAHWRWLSIKHEMLEIRLNISYLAEQLYHVREAQTLEPSTMDHQAIKLHGEMLLLLAKEIKTLREK